MNRTNPSQYVNMIAGAVDYESSAAQFANDAAQVREEVRPDFRCDQGDAPFGAENDMHDNVSAGLGHVFRPFRALSHSVSSRGHVLRFRPGTYFTLFGPVGWVWFLFFSHRNRRGGGNVGIHGFGISTFPSP